MDIYAVILNEVTDQNPAWDILEAIADSHYKLNNSVALVAPKREFDLTEKISEAFGMNNDVRRFGVVIKVDSYYGYNSPGVWEWIKKVQERS